MPEHDDPARARRRRRGRPDGQRSRPASNARTTAFGRRVAAAYRELAGDVPRAVRHHRRHRATRGRSPRRSMEPLQVADGPFAGVPEQHEAKRLLEAALADGDAHAFLFHGPPGVGKTTRRVRVRRRAARRPAARRGADAPRPARRRAARRHDPDRRRPRAAPRPPPASVRGRPPRLPPARRPPAQRGRGRRVAQGSRGAAALRDDRAGRRRARAAAGDDPLALPARPLPPALRARGARRGSPSTRPSSARRRRPRSPASRVVGSIAPGGCSTPRCASDGRRSSPRRADRISTRRSTPPDASRALLDAISLRGRAAKDGEEEVVAGLDLPPREAEQRVKRVQRGAEREELLAQLEELVGLVPRPRRRRGGSRERDDPRRPPRRPPCRRRARPRSQAGDGGGARPAGVALGGGVQRQRRLWLDALFVQLRRAFA